MNILESIFLGMVQGITEFLPISSSGHLVFFQSLFGMEEPQLFFDVMVHFGTLLAVVVYFRKDIWGIIIGVKGLLKRGERNKEGVKLLFLIIVATIPSGLMGIFFKDWFESLFSKPKIVGIMLLITGLVLWLTRFSKEEGKKIGKMSVKDALFIGIAQGAAIIPGISRSGTTISTGLLCGLDRELSGKFSFLLSIPAVLGATFLESRKFGSVSEVWMSLPGMIIAFIGGLFSLTFLIKMIKFGKMKNFSYYCWGVGILMIFIAR